MVDLCLIKYCLLCGCNSHLTMYMYHPSPSHFTVYMYHPFTLFPPPLLPLTPLSITTPAPQFDPTSLFPSSSLPPSIQLNVPLTHIPPSPPSLHISLLSLLSVMEVSLLQFWSSNDNRSLSTTCQESRSTHC